MEINGVITNSILTPQAFAAECELVYEGNAAKASFAFPMTNDNLAHLLTVAGASCWEQVVGKPVKLRMNETEDKKVLKLESVGHFLTDQWMDIEQPNEEEKSPQAINFNTEVRTNDN